MSEPVRDVANPNADWCIEVPGGRTIIRDHGKVVYDGPTADMNPEMRRLADEYTIPWGHNQAPAQAQETAPQGNNQPGGSRTA